MGFDSNHLEMVLQRVRNEYLPMINNLTLTEFVELVQF